MDQLQPSHKMTFMNRTIDNYRLFWGSYRVNSVQFGLFSNSTEHHESVWHTWADLTCCDVVSLMSHRRLVPLRCFSCSSPDEFKYVELRLATPHGLTASSQLGPMGGEARLLDPATDGVIRQTPSQTQKRKGEEEKFQFTRVQTRSSCPSWLEEFLLILTTTNNFLSATFNEKLIKN